MPDSRRARRRPGRGAFEGRNSRLHIPRGMGYIGNMLPRHLARLGADVHYVTMDLPHYFQGQAPTQTYAGFSGGTVTSPGSVESLDGFTLHGLAHRRSLGQARFEGLRRKLEEIRPDVVQSLLAIGWPPLDAAILRDHWVTGYSRQPRTPRCFRWPRVMFHAGIRRCSGTSARGFSGALHQPAHGEVLRARGGLRGRRGAFLRGAEIEDRARAPWCRYRPVPAGVD